MNGQWVWAFVPTLAPSSFSCDGPVPPPPFRTPMAPMAPMSMAMGPPGNMEWRPTPKKMPRNQGASAKVIVPKSIPIGKVNVPKPEAVPVEKVDVPKPEAVPVEKVDVPKQEAVPIGKVDVPTVAEEMLSQPRPVEEPSQSQNMSESQWQKCHQCHAMFQSQPVTRSNKVELVPMTVPSLRRLRRSSLMILKKKSSPGLFLPESG